MPTLGRQALARALVLTALLLASEAARPPPGREDGGASAAAPAPNDRALPPRQPIDVPQPFQFTPRTLLTLLISLLVSALSNAAGVGGGAIFVPLFNVLLLFPIKAATALSQAVITGGALGSVSYSLGRRHPNAATSPLIDFDLALVLAPPLLLGVSCGVLLNIALPSWLITLLLIPLLALLTWRTAQMGLRMWQTEQQVQQRRLCASGTQPAQQVQLASDGSPAPSSMELPSCCGRDAGGQQKEQQEWQRQRQQQHGQHQLQQLKSRRALEAGDNSDWQFGSADGWQIASAGALSEGGPKHVQQGRCRQPRPGKDGSCGAADGADALPHQRRREPGDLLQQAQPGLQQIEGQEQLRLTEGCAKPGQPPAHPESMQHEAPAEQSAGIPAPCVSTQCGPLCDVVTSGSAGKQGSHSDMGPGLGTQAENEARMAGLQASSLGCWLSSPGLLDGVLEPGSARSTPVPVDAPPASVGQCQLRHPCPSAAGSSRSEQEAGSSPETQLALPSSHNMVQPWAMQRAAGVESFVGQSSKQHEQAPSLQLPWLRIAEILLLWALFFCFQVGKERYPRCSWQAGLFIGSQAALALALTALFSWQACRGASLCTRERDEEQPILRTRCPISSPSTDSGSRAAQPALNASAPTWHARTLPGWSWRQLATASAVCLAGGCAAGTLGIGGGMIMAPLFLELGLHPQAASATSGLLVLFSASSAALSFAAAGRLNPSAAAAFGSASMAAAFLGSFVIGRAVRHSGRASLLVLILAGIIGLGAIVTAAFSGEHAVQELLGSALAGPAAPFCA